MRVADKNFAKIIPKLHTRGLRKALRTIKSLTSDLDHELESSKNCRLGVKQEILKMIWNPGNKVQVPIISSKLLLAHRRKG